MMPPIIIAAFGTTSRSRAVYEKVDRHLKARFTGHDIHWAYTLRTIRRHLKKRNIETFDPATVVACLADQDHPWAVVQSFNIICAEDLVGREDSWKTALEAHDLQVALESEALGSRVSIIDIFATHIHSALAVIPATEAPKTSNPIYTCDRR